MEAKRKNKSLKVCLARMKESRDCWKARALCFGERVKKGDALQRSIKRSRESCLR